VVALLHFHAPLRLALSLCLQVWRNHAGLVEALLEAGADPDAQDSESGWTALHRALHWGQLRIAAALLGANASLTVPDWRGRSPLDLLSAELKEYVEPGGDGDVFSWGGHYLSCRRSPQGAWKCHWHMLDPATAALGCKL
jgi:ankyrin repeat protein